MDDCVYVDKTAYVRQLLTNGNYYFLSRPRRFGKSLLVDTLHQLFAGNEALFRGLSHPGILIRSKNRDTTVKPEQNPESTADYASREQELLAYLREAERAASAGEIGDMLKIQARLHSILMGIIGNQTQQAFRVHYRVRNL